MGGMCLCGVRMVCLMVYQMTPRKKSKVVRVDARVYSTATIDLGYSPDQAGRPDFVIPESNAAAQVKRGFVPDPSFAPGF
jgi:hypothetical protein